MALEFICEDCLWDSKAWEANTDGMGPGICARCSQTKLVKGFRKVQFADIQAPRPKPKPPAIDWDTIKADFIAQTEYKQPRDYLRSLGWSEARLVAGNTQNAIVGWGRERAEERQILLEQAKADAREKLADMIPDLYLAKHKIIQKLTAKLENSLDIDEFIDILKVIKTELGEPTTVSKQQITTDETVQEAIEELRNVVTARREGANAGGSDSSTSAAVS